MYISSKLILKFLKLKNQFEFKLSHLIKTKSALSVYKIKYTYTSSEIPTIGAQIASESVNVTSARMPGTRRIRSFPTSALGPALENLERCYSDNQKTLE